MADIPSVPEAAAARQHGPEPSFGQRQGAPKQGEPKGGNVSPSSSVNRSSSSGDSVNTGGLPTSSVGGSSTLECDARRGGHQPQQDKEGARADPTAVQRSGGPSSHGRKGYGAPTNRTPRSLILSLNALGGSTAGNENRRDLGSSNRRGCSFATNPTRSSGQFYNSGSSQTAKPARSPTGKSSGVKDVGKSYDEDFPELRVPPPSMEQRRIEQQSAHGGKGKSATSLHEKDSALQSAHVPSVDQRPFAKPPKAEGGASPAQQPMRAPNQRIPTNAPTTMKPTHLSLRRSPAVTEGSGELCKAAVSEQGASALPINQPRFHQPSPRGERGNSFLRNSRGSSKHAESSRRDSVHHGTPAASMNSQRFAGRPNARGGSVTAEHRTRASGQRIGNYATTTSKPARSSVGKSPGLKKRGVGELTDVDFPELGAVNTPTRPTGFGGTQSRTNTSTSANLTRARGQEVTSNAPITGVAKGSDGFGSDRAGIKEKDMADQGVATSVAQLVIHRPGGALISVNEVDVPVKEDIKHNPTGDKPSVPVEQSCGIGNEDARVIGEDVIQQDRNGEKGISSASLVQPVIRRSGRASVSLDEVPVKEDIKHDPTGDKPSVPVEQPCGIGNDEARVIGEDVIQQDRNGEKGIPSASLVQPVIRRSGRASVSLDEVPVKEDIKHDPTGDKPSVPVEQPCGIGNDEARVIGEDVIQQDRNGEKGIPSASLVQPVIRRSGRASVSLDEVPVKEDIKHDPTDDKPAVPVEQPRGIDIDEARVIRENTILLGMSAAATEVPYIGSPSYLKGGSSVAVNRADDSLLACTDDPSTPDEPNSFIEEDSGFHDGSVSINGGDAAHQGAPVVHEKQEGLAQSTSNATGIESVPANSADVTAQKDKNCSPANGKAAPAPDEGSPADYVRRVAGIFKADTTDEVGNTASVERQAYLVVGPRIWMTPAQVPGFVHSQANYDPHASTFAPFVGGPGQYQAGSPMSGTSWYQQGMAYGVSNVPIDICGGQLVLMQGPYYVYNGQVIPHGPTGPHLPPVMVYNINVSNGQYGVNGAHRTVGQSGFYHGVGDGMNQAMDKNDGQQHSSQQDSNGNLQTTDEMKKRCSDAGKEEAGAYYQPPLNGVVHQSSVPSVHAENCGSGFWTNFMTGLGSGAHGNQQRTPRRTRRRMRGRQRKRARNRQSQSKDGGSGEAEDLKEQHAPNVGSVDPSFHAGSDRCDRRTNEGTKPPGKEEIENQRAKDSNSDANEIVAAGTNNVPHKKEKYPRRDRGRKSSRNKEAREAKENKKEENVGQDDVVGE